MADQLQALPILLSLLTADLQLNSVFHTDTFAYMCTSHAIIRASPMYTGLGMPSVREGSRDFQVC